ncbi:MAG: hypothetical protein ACRDDX_04490 [Cellulosilyticaceae bacterium]
MFFKDDNTYNDMRKAATMQWLTDLLESEDVVNKNSAKVALEHIAYLEKQIQALEDKNALKDRFLKQLKAKQMNK